MSGKILISVAVYDGDAHCRPAFLKSLERLSKPSGTDLLFVSDEDSPGTTGELKVWRGKGTYGFNNIEIIEAPRYVEELTYEDYQRGFYGANPVGSPGIFCTSNHWVRVSPKSGYFFRQAIKKIVIKREIARKFAVQHEFGSLLTLDSDLEVEENGLVKLIGIGCGVAAVLYNNYLLPDPVVSELMNSESAVFFSYKAFHKFRDEWKPGIRVSRAAEIDWKGRNFQPVFFAQVRKHLKGTEFHVSGQCGGCMLIRRDYFQASHFFYYEPVPCMPMGDDTAFFIPFFFRKWMTSSAPLPLRPFIIWMRKRSCGCSIFFALPAEKL